MSPPRAFAVAALLALSALPAGAQSGNHLACLVHDAPGDGRLATCTGRVSPRHPEWRFVLRGRAPNIIGSIEVYETGRETPRQTLSGFDVRPRLVPGDGIAPGRVDFVLQDVNFDRFNDLRLAVGPPDGDGTAYHWFLFDKDADAFVPTDVLDGLRDPLFNPRRRLISSSFKDERGRTGRVTYKWRDGKLDASGAFAHERTEDGRCIATHYVMRDGRFEKKTETECRAGEELERE